MEWIITEFCCSDVIRDVHCRLREFSRWLGKYCLYRSYCFRPSPQHHRSTERKADGYGYWVVYGMTAMSGRRLPDSAPVNAACSHRNLMFPFRRRSSPIFARFFPLASGSGEYRQPAAAADSFCAGKWEERYVCCSAEGAPSFEVLPCLACP